MKNLTVRVTDRHREILAAMPGSDSEVVRTLIQWIGDYPHRYVKVYSDVQEMRQEVQEDE